MKLIRLSRFHYFVHIGALIPLLWIILDFFTDNLTANPIQAVTLRTGKAALILLVLTLAMTPVYTLFGFKQVLKVRRALGLYTFMYASLHFAIFIGVDYVFDIELIYEALFEKRFALVGLMTGLILLPLALTSTKGWMRRLGKNWKRLHWLVYLAGLLGVVHYAWSVKSDIRQPLAFGVVILLLLIARIPVVRRALSHYRWRLSPWLKQIINRIRRVISSMVQSHSSGENMVDSS